MQLWMLDLFLVVLVLGITYALTSEGLWGAALIFFNVLFSALIALNFYETLAQLLANNVSSMKSWADFLCLSALFLVSLVALKTFTENVAPRIVRLPHLLYQLGRLVFGLGAGLLTVGFLMIVLDTAPVQRKVLGILDYKAKSPFGLALDRKVLGFFQWTTAYIFPSYVSSEERNDPEFRNAKVFDPDGGWLLRHQNARPFPEGKSVGRVPEPGGEEEAAPSTNSDNASTDSQASNNSDSPRVPGGTAGAAAGLAPGN
jgi:hypothetical protein